MEIKVDRLAIVGFVMLCMVFGFGRLLRNRKKLTQEGEFIKEFLENLKKYAMSNGQDMEAYGQLLMCQYKMQSILGPYGIVSLEMPYTRRVVRNYHIIPNHLMSLRQGISDRSPYAGEYHDQMIACIFGYIGILNQAAETLYDEIRNPLVWFREGVRFILSLPFVVLSSLGLLGNDRSEKVVKSRAFSIGASVVALIGFLSAVISIFAGIQPTVEFLKRIFNIS